MDFCYLARRSSHDEVALQAMTAALAKFHELRKIFVDEGIRPDGFGLPRQHSLDHYVRGIRLFGSPNGLCSSITESKHIVAVKRPWRESSRFNALGQMIRKITRRNKLAALRVQLGISGLLKYPLRLAARIDAGLAEPSDEDEDDWEDVDGFGMGGADADEADDEDDAGAVQGTRRRRYTRLARKPGGL